MSSHKKILSQTDGSAIMLAILWTAVWLSTDTHAELRFDGEARVRYETLDGQFRAGRSGSDQIIATRALLRLDYQRRSLRWFAELHDARSFLDDQGTPLSGSFVNTLELLQAYAELPVGTGQGETALKLGRMTLDIGSRRFVERNQFRNTVNAYSGAQLWHTNDQDARLDAFVVMPLVKRPLARDALADNDVAVDRADSRRLFYGVHWQRPIQSADLQLNLFAYGLEESDRPGRPTADRSVIAPGIRLFRSPKRGAFDFDIETAVRRGKRSTSDASDAKTQDVRAYMLHAEVGYTFDHPLQPRIGLEYDGASGDKPGNVRYERYERFYGTRRGDLGNTSIHGPLTRSNIVAPGVRLSFAGTRLDGRALVQLARLDSATDGWLVARRSDPLGTSGKQLGTALDYRLRYWLIPKSLRLEIGGSVFWFGDYAERLAEPIRGDRTRYVYSSLNWDF